MLVFITAIPLFSQVFPGIEQKPRWLIGFQSVLGPGYNQLWADTSNVWIDGKEWTSVIGATYFDDNDPFYVPDTLIYAYYRVEGLQVFIQNPGTTFGFAQGLLYDFSLNKGDSTYVLAPWDFPSDSILYRVEEVDTIYCDEIGKRRLKVSFHLDEPNVQEVFYSTYWVEGIGDIYHPFLPLTCMFGNCEVGGFQTQLILEGDSLMTYSEQCITTATNEVNPEVDFSISPNPVSLGEAVSIKIPEIGYDKSLVLKVFDVTGKVVMEQRVNSGTASLSFSTLTFNSGLYWVSLSDESKMIHTQALVVLE